MVRSFARWLDQEFRLSQLINKLLSELPRFFVRQWMEGENDLASSRDCDADASV